MVDGREAISATALNATGLMDFKPKDITARVDIDEALLYALSIGIGRDPLDPRQLRLVYERDLQVFPTLAHILATDTSWMDDPAIGVDKAMLVHLASRLEIQTPLPLEVDMIGRTQIEALYDRGGDRGAIVKIVCRLNRQNDELLLATVRETFLLRSNGGFGGEPPPPQDRALPGRAPDLRIPRTIMPQAALLYRLNLDRNPLHVDPEVAQRAGFAVPILHGACTQAIIADVLLETLADYDVKRLIELDATFRAPICPGDTLEVQIWREGDGRIAYQGVEKTQERTIIVGRAAFLN